MIKPIIKNILKPFLFIIALITAAKAEFHFDPYIQGSPIFRTTQVSFANHTHTYKLWLRTSAIKFCCDMKQIDDHNPIGASWIMPGIGVEKLNRGFMSYGTGYIFYRKASSNNELSPYTFMNSTYVIFDLKNGVQEFDHVIVKVECQPVPIYICSDEIVPDSAQEWTFEMYNYNITVTEKIQMEL